ncbi:MAG: HAMP domain-containing sensor histidine kinase [Desulfobacterales bacterium]
MKSLRRLILVFAVGLCLPLGYLVLHSYRSLDAEEAATLSFFAEALFDEMQEAAAALIRREEARPIDAYTDPGASPLSGLPAEEYLRGYFQNNPDGSFQSPHRADEALSAQRVAELEEANRMFNRKRAEGTDRIRPEAADALRDESRQEQAGFAGRYLDLSRSQRSKSYLGERESRLETVTPGQVSSLAKTEKKAAAPSAVVDGAQSRQRFAEAPPPVARESAAGAAAVKPGPPPGAADAREVQAEVAPFQSVFIDEGRIFTFRRILIDGRMYRQGFLIELDALFSDLIRSHFSAQPMAAFTRLRLRAVDQGREKLAAEAGAAADRPRVVLERAFPPPFAFLRATLASEVVPPSAGRSTLNLALAALAAVIFAGLLALYHSAKKVVEFSERQSRFVSAVTHELKTPLTNIRMYIEMLEQGMARDPEREQGYFRILQSEGARLSRLIANVLELSKLEKRHRRPDLKAGSFEEVLGDLEDAMGEALRQAGFVLKCENRLTRPFRYDREIMVQVLVNLIENSIKFGTSSAVRAITVRLREEGERVRVEVADTGPGIPEPDVKKIFNDFYRAENAVTSAAGGTGIGLALVKRFVGLVGGRVSAYNNSGPGCTIAIDLPR